MRTRMPRLVGTLLGSAALGSALLVAGCGSGDSPASPAPPASSDAASSSAPAASAPVSAPPGTPQEAYVAWLAALERHDAAAACARHAPDFTIALRYRAILLDRAGLGDPCTGFVAVLWEDPAREYAPTSVEATQVTGERARLAADFPGTDESVTLEKRNGSWFVAATQPRVDAADGAGAAEGPGRWLAGWCSLALGMDRDVVTEVMGEPSGEYTIENGGEPQLYWARRQYDFRAYLDRQGRVIDLVGDYDRLSAADRDRLPCPELR